MFVLFRTCTPRRFLYLQFFFVCASAGYILFPGYFENRIPLKPALGGVCSLANYSVAYEETQLNRVSKFCDCVYSLFPKAILFDFYISYIASFVLSIFVPYLFFF